MTHSCLYHGTVMHHRLTPVRHRFRTEVTSLYLDLDEVANLKLPFFSFGRWNLMSVLPTDLGDAQKESQTGQAPASAPPSLAPRRWAEQQLAAHGLSPDGPIRVHLFPRILGMGFTPLTTWFCFTPQDTLKAIIYEVHNTFGERHSYLVPLPDSASGPDHDKTLTHQAEKCFHVSPFLEAIGRYHFAIRPPADRYAQVIKETIPLGSVCAPRPTAPAPAMDDGDAAAIGGADQPQNQVTVLIASHMGRRQPLTSGAIVKTALRFPLLPLKVFGGIHWEALRLWLKGAPFFRKPPAPDASVSYCPQEDAP